jgi:hypothetical protein
MDKVIDSYANGIHTYWMLRFLFSLEIPSLFLNVLIAYNYVIWRSHVNAIKEKDTKKKRSN